MYSVRKVTSDIYWIGVNDRRTDRFENIHPIPEGTSYNSYLLKDEKTVLFDAVEWGLARRFIENLEFALDGRKLDYIVVHHMEPDHGSSLAYVMEKHPEATVVTTKRSAQMMKQFGFSKEDRKIIEVGEKDTLDTGKRKITFYMAAMVHWPEVMVSYESTEQVLFSADAFGTFGTLDGKLFSDEVGYEKNFEEYARRYYSNIVGKYGVQVQALLKKLSGVPLRYICSLHGPVVRTKKDITYILDKYDKWSTYTPEEKGVLICFCSMYGGTENAADILGEKLAERGMANFEMYDVSKTHVSTLISKTFKYSHLALFGVTYNMKLFPVMRDYLDDMEALNVQNRDVVIGENGSWAPQAGNVLIAGLKRMKDMRILNEEKMTVKSMPTLENVKEIDELAKKIIDSMK